MTNENSPAKWFYVVAAIALVWNLLGVAAFVMHLTITPEMIAQMPAEQAQLYASNPWWFKAAFGCAVLGGALGCVMLLMKKRLALTCFVISLVGLVVQNYHAFFVVDSFAVFGPGGIIMPIMVVLIAIYLIYLAKSSTQKGWLS